MNIATLILAAGQSSRMGSAKQLLPVEKTTLLGITIESALQSNANNVFCVLGANAEVIENAIEKYDIEIIFNSNYKNGLSTSIVEGITHLKSKSFDGVLIVLGDQPYISSRYLNVMVKAYAAQNEKIIASNYKDNLGVPAIIPKKYYNELLLLKGDKGAKSILNSNKKNIIHVKQTNLVDIDTKEDYLEFLKTYNLNKKL